MMGKWFAFWFCLLTFNSVALCQPQGEAQPKIYKGLRINLFGFKLVDQSEKSATLKCSVANTGRETVSFNKSKRPPEALLVELDTNSLPKNLLGKEERIAETLFREKIHLTAGQIQQGLSLKISLHEPKTDKNTEQQDTTPKGKNQSKPEPQPTPPPETPEQLEAEEAKFPEIEAPYDANSMQPIENQTLCVDLVFDTVYILKRSEKSMTLNYVIRNAGERAVYLLGKTREKEDNLAVNVYFVSGVKLTRGSFLADGIFLKDKDVQNGELKPGQTFKGEIEISLKSRTRFQPNLVFELDPFQSVVECDKTNNTKALIVKN